MLSKEMKAAFRRQAHNLKPVVLIGQHGLTPAVLNEINLALDAHELIKIRIAGAERDEKHAMMEEILAQTGAESIHIIGHTLSLWRQAPEKPRK